jgi:hypothetical protein
MSSEPSAFTVLRDFIRSRMRMSHIYQPVMLRTLLVHFGKATIRQIAAEFLARDESQPEYYGAARSLMFTCQYRFGGCYWSYRYYCSYRHYWSHNLQYYL